MNILTILFGAGFVGMTILAFVFLRSARKSDLAAAVARKETAKARKLHEGLLGQLEALKRERDIARNERQRMFDLHQTLNDGDIRLIEQERTPQARQDRRFTDRPLHVGGFAVTEIFNPQTQIME